LSLCLFSFGWALKPTKVFTPEGILRQRKEKEKFCYKRTKPIMICLKKFFFISCRFTIYSTNGAISKYVIRKHLCEAIIQWWFSYIYYTLCCACVYSSSSLWSLKSEGHCRFSLRLTFNGFLNSVT
jgi:hypothetical protein